MNIILLDKIANLGGLGDQVTVKSGYARNFLFPQGKAVPATKDNVEKFEARRAELEAKIAEQLAAANARAEKVAELAEVTIAAPAGDEGKLFGSVGTRDIADAITAAGVEVQKAEVKLPTGTLRETGEYDIEIPTNTDFDFVLTAQDFHTHKGSFNIPTQDTEYDLFQEIRLDKLLDKKGRVYAQKATINNAFFNVDQVAIAQYPDIDFTQFSQEQIDSVRFAITETTSPIELMNYVKQSEILDPNGTPLAQATLGRLYVPDAPMKEIDLLYQNAIDSADNHFEENRLPEARANYLIASDIKPEETYPKEQVLKIDGVLNDQPFEALLAYLPEVDNGEMVLNDTTVDEAEVELPEEEIVEPVEEVLEIAEETTEVEVEVEIVEEAVVETEATEEVEEEIAIVNQEEPKVVEEIVETEVTEESIEPIVESQPIEEELIASTEDNEQETEIAEVEVEEETESPIALQEENPMDASQKIVFRNILFDFDKDDLRAASITELNRISAYMISQPSVDLRIDGHTDWIGSIEYNLNLSERRAQRAYFYLLSEGISEGRLSYQYFGESLPIAPNANPDGSDNPEGRQLNRRCEFKIDETGTAENVIMKF